MSLPGNQTSLYSLVFEASSDGILVFDTGAYLCEVNSAASLLGVSKTAIGQHAAQVLDALPDIARQVTSGQTLSVCAVLDKRWLELRLEPFQLGSMLTVRDVSAQKQLELKLEQDYAKSEAKYRDLVENAGDVIYRIDTAGYFSYGNAAAVNLGEYPLDAFIGMHFLKLVRPDYRDKTMLFYMQQLQNEETKSYFEFPLLSRTGKTYWMGQTVQLVQEHGQVTGMQAVARDITERIKTEQALTRRTAELESANADLEQFAFIAAHDLQEPLRKLQAFGDRLKDRCAADLDAKGKDYLNRMLGSSRRLSSLVEDLLAFTQLAKDSVYEQISLASTVKEVLAKYNTALSEAKASVSVDSLPKLRAKPQQLYSLVDQLIANALAFRSLERPLVLEVSSKVERNQFKLVVTDNGSGFDEIYLDKIFDVFKRLHHRNRYEGNGVGLALCRRIAEGHGGTITASSQLGVGSSFVVSLPCDLVEQGSDEPVLAGQVLEAVA